MQDSAVTIRLRNLVDGFDLQNEEYASYLDRQTGEVVTIAHEETRAVERGALLEEFPEWQREMISLAQALLEDTSHRFLNLPDRWDFHEYGVMKEFCGSLGDTDASDVLFRAIQGKGAFRRFKDTLYQLGMIEQWYRYRDDALKELLVRWCRANNVEIVD
ncbi:MAG: UPF0158 family protein [Magnetococcus sp. YQC-9]